MKGGKTLVTKNSRNGKKETSPRRHGRHGERLRREATAEGADRIFYVRFGLRPARRPSAERNVFPLFDFPAMNRWAFLYRPAERDSRPCRLVTDPMAKEKTPSTLSKEEDCCLRASLFSCQAHSPSVVCPRR